MDKIFTNSPAVRLFKSYALNQKDTETAVKRLAIIFSGVISFALINYRVYVHFRPKLVELETKKLLEDRAAEYEDIQAEED